MIRNNPFGLKEIICDGFWAAFVIKIDNFQKMASAEASILAMSS